MVPFEDIEASLAHRVRELSIEAWRVLSGGVGLPAPLRCIGGEDRIESRLPVTVVGISAIAASLMSAALLSSVRYGYAPQPVEIDVEEATVALSSEKHVRRAAGAIPVGFDPLSRFWHGADGVVRTHANYAWHRRCFLAVLGSSDNPEEVERTIRSWSVGELEAAIAVAGGCAAAVRRPTCWASHPQGRAVADLPLIELLQIGDAPVRAPRPGLSAASGVRVLDLTRVIAGPVATRTLAAHGADVLRIDPPGLPELEFHQVDGFVGKRSALLDLATKRGADSIHQLLADADVLVYGYRPGALERLGLGAAAITKRYPELVIVHLSAWGHAGPWATRRGFDSLVQAATGISTIEADDDGVPRALPVQLLDHATGYLAAAGALVALAETL